MGNKISNFKLKEGSPLNTNLPSFKVYDMDKPLNIYIASIPKFTPHGDELVGYFRLYGSDVEDVRCEIDGREYIYALAVGEDRDYSIERIYDMKISSFECTVRDVSRDVLEELLRGTNS